MEARPIRCRRARRTDADAIFALVARPADARDRRAHHQFRKLIADLGADCYVALCDEVVIGVVHLTYARRLLDGPCATVELMRAAEGHHDDAGRALAALVRDRARRRHCRLIDWRAAPSDPAAHALATALGAHPIGDQVRVEIPVPRE